MKRSSILRLGGWLALATSVSVYLLLSAMTFHQPFHVGPRQLRFFDLRVYRGAARRIIDSDALYKRPIIRRLGFTYPPAAALVLAPLALFPLAVDKIVVTGLNVAALVSMLYHTLRFADVQMRRTLLWSLAASIAAATLWLEPVTTTLGYGQIDLLIVTLIMFDLSRPDDAPYQGIAIGIAAGIKLTPLLFIIYLAVAGRRRTAAVAAGGFVATILISFATAGQDAGRYWGGLILDSSRVGGAEDAANQSLRGALARLTDTPHPWAGTELIVVVVALLGLALAATAARQGKPTLGFGLAAVTTLLASPVSWTHHWTLAIPALVLLAIAAYRDRSIPLAVGALAGAVVGYAYVPERFMGTRQLTTGISSIPADPYVIVGLAVLAVVAAHQVSLRRRLGRRTPARPVPA